MGVEMGELARTPQFADRGFFRGAFRGMRSRLLFPRPLDRGARGPRSYLGH
jgi:hypothetical protein